MVNSTVINSGVHAFFIIMVFSAYVPGVGLLDYMTTYFQFFLNLIEVVPIYIPSIV